VSLSAGQAPRALYIQVKEYILARIESGQWPPDARIPSENQLVETLKVSRMTVNRALRELAVEGRLVRIQGVGSFVAQPKPVTALFEIQSIDDEVRGWGGVYACEVRLLAEERAYAELAAAMALPLGAPVFHSIIVHRDRGRPVLLGDRYVNPVVAPHYLEQDFTTITPTKYLLRTAPVTKVEHIIEAVRPEDEVCRLLEIEADEPCLVLHRQTWNDTLVNTHSRFSYPGSRYRIGGRFAPVVKSNTRGSPLRALGGLP
jgi:GntR family histidine utilization transcriptional repressor